MKLGCLEFKEDDFQSDGEWVNPAYAYQLANALLEQRLNRCFLLFMQEEPTPFHDLSEISAFVEDLLN